VLAERARLLENADLDLAETGPALGQSRELDRAGVAKFKWPERLELIEAMPLTPTQKVMRGRLRERLKT